MCECENNGMGRFTAGKRMLAEDVFGLEPAPGDRVIYDPYYPFIPDEEIPIGTLPSGNPVIDQVPEPVVDPAINPVVSGTNWLPILVVAGVIGYFAMKGK